MSDITWHGLEGLEDGYLRVLGNLAFHGSFGDAHSFGDLADDMIGVFEWNVTTYAYEWFVPVGDLVEIYSDYYGAGNALTEDVVNVCSGMLLIGRLAEQVAGKNLYYYYSKETPVMLDMFRDYFLGGLDDMATWTSIVWRQAATALLNGTENCDIPHNTLGLSCHMESVVEMMSENVYHDPAELIQFEFLPTLDDLEFVPEGTGVRIRIPREKVDLALKTAADLNPDTSTENEESDLSPMFVITTRQVSTLLSSRVEQNLFSDPYATLGKHFELIDIDGNGATDMLGLQSVSFLFILPSIFHPEKMQNIEIHQLKLESDLSASISSRGPRLCLSAERSRAQAERRWCQQNRGNCGPHSLLSGGVRQVRDVLRCTGREC